MKTLYTFRKKFLALVSRVISACSFESHRIITCGLKCTLKLSGEVNPGGKISHTLHSGA